MSYTCLTWLVVTTTKLAKTEFSLIILMWSYVSVSSFQFDHWKSDQVPSSPEAGCCCLCCASGGTNLGVGTHWKHLMEGWKHNFLCSHEMAHIPFVLALRNWRDKSRKCIKWLLISTVTQERLKSDTFLRMYLSNGRTMRVPSNCCPAMKKRNKTCFLTEMIQALPICTLNFGLDILWMEAQRRRRGCGCVSSRTWCSLWQLYLKERLILVVYNLEGYIQHSVLSVELKDSSQHSVTSDEFFVLQEEHLFLVFSWWSALGVIITLSVR